MVTNVTSLGRSGLYDWLIQRATAVIIAVYFIVVLGFMMLNSPLTYGDWTSFMGCTLMRIFNLITFISILAHAWVGLWTISTDYIKPTMIRFAFQAVCGLALFSFFIWAVQIVWGVQ